jgi:putative tricarboxylic transport membrane protein
MLFSGSRTLQSAPAKRPDAAGTVVSGVLLLLAGVIVWDTSTLQLAPTYGVGPKAMPYLIAAALVLLAGGNFVLGWRAGFPERDNVDPRAIALILGGLAALIATIGLGGGFIPATTILFAATAAAFGRRALHIDLVIGLLLALVAYLLFDKLLALSLPAGPLERVF